MMLLSKTRKLTAKLRTDYFFIHIFTVNKLQLYCADTNPHNFYQLYESY